MLRDDDNPDDSPAGDDDHDKAHSESLASDDDGDDGLDLSMPGSEVEYWFRRMISRDSAGVRAMVGRLCGATRGATEVGLYLCDEIRDGKRKLMLLALNAVARGFLVSGDPALVGWGAELTDKLAQTARLAVMLDVARDQAGYISGMRHCGGVVQPGLWDDLGMSELRRNVIELCSTARNCSTS